METHDSSSSTLGLTSPEINDFNEELQSFEGSFGKGISQSCTLSTLSTIRKRRRCCEDESKFKTTYANHPISDCFADVVPNHENDAKEYSLMDVIKSESSNYLCTPPPIRRLFQLSDRNDSLRVESSSSSIQGLKNNAVSVLSNALNTCSHFRIRPKIPRIPFLPRLRRRTTYIRFASQPSQQPLLSERSKGWLIPAEHPVKVIWDFLTVLLSIVNAYSTHVAIGDRSIGTLHSWQQFCNIWFFVDILLNFVTETKLSTSSSDKNEEEGRRVLTKCQAVWARYLTTWFVIDLLSLVPGEALFVKPIIEQQKRRGFFQKQLFRIRAVCRFLAGDIVRRVRPRHLTMFSTVANISKRAGMGGPAFLLRKILKYVPKYVLFIRKMKALLALRALRQVHWLRKAWYNLSTIVQRRGGDIDTALQSMHRTSSFCNDIDDGIISMTCEGDFDSFPDRDLDNASYDSEVNELVGEVDECMDNWCQSSRCRVILVDSNDAWEIIDDNTHIFSQIGSDQDAIEEDEYNDSDDGYPY